MTDGIKILLLVAFFVAGCMAAGLYGRRIRAHAGHDWVARYLRLRSLLVIYGIVLILEAMVIPWERHNQSIFKEAMPVICFGLAGLAFGTILIQFLGARKKMLELPEHARLKKKRLPLFFWQAVFILLPVAGLAGFGLYSLGEDRLLAEQEARTSGQILAERLVQAIGTEGAQYLRDYREASFCLLANREADLGLTSWAGGWATESNEWLHIKAWQQANPDIDLDTLPPTEVSSYVEDKPERMPPQAPEWLGQLSPEQQQLWLAAKESEFTVKDFPATQAAIEKFIATKPPKGARANAEYLLLLAKTSGLAGPEAAAQFAASLWVNSDETTEAGLPIGQLICYQALRLTPTGAGVPYKLRKTIPWAITYRPSFFSPYLIAEAERVSKGTDTEAFAATLKDWWETGAKARLVLGDFFQLHPTNTLEIAPYWVNSSAGRFLLLLGDRWTNPTNWPASAEIRYAYLMLPEAVVKKALATAVSQADISLPPYALVEFEIAGKPVVLSGDEMPAATNNPAPVLGQAAGKWEHLPLNDHSYPFQIRVLLTRPEILYARQRQRTWLFGALIVASMVAAALGLFSAWRSYLREQRLNELKTNFVSSVSHELRAPIASVRLMAENLDRGKIPDPARQGEYFRFIVQECRRLSSLIENVLDFSRIEQGRKQYEFEPTNLATLAETTVKLMEPYAAEKGVSLHFETSNLQPSTFNFELDVDGRALQQALVNLIDNAVKHSPKGEVVTVEIKKADADAIALSVADHGPGIPAGEYEKIFERFYRLGSELRRETQGVGIGLSVVKHIVEAHGGRVLVESEIGKGSRFTIELPVKK